MTLLNKTLPFIETYRTPEVKEFPCELPTSGLALLLDDFAKTNDFWYCYITTITSLKIFSIVDLMGKDVYSKICNKKASLVIDLSFEPFLLCIDTVYTDVILKYNIPSSQVIFMSNMFDANQYNKQAAKKYNTDPCRIFYFSALEYMLYHRALRNEPKSLEIKHYDKKFLNLNRRWREHRPLTVLLLRYQNLLDKGYVSFGPCENHGDWDKIWDGLYVGAIGNQYLTQAIMESKDIKNMAPLYLDTDELHTNRAELETSTHKFYQNSYFSLVSETTFYNRNIEQSSRFITEKTFKPIAMKHPFVLISIAKSLEVLKFLGYKSFHPFINESYDNELDDNKRLLMVLDEVKRLCNLKYYELGTFLVETNKICQYNFDLLKSKSKFIYEMN